MNMFIVKNEDRLIKTILFMISFLFLILGLYSVIKYGNSNLLGSLEQMDNDDVKYIRSAWTLLETGMLTYHTVNEPTVYIMPGLSCTLAFFMAIFGKLQGIVAFRIFQVILQTLSFFLLFCLGKKIFGSRVGVIACILQFLSVSEYYVPTLILTESIFKFLLLLLVYVSVLAVVEKKSRYYTLGGLIWGIACLFRPTIAAYPVIILILWLIKKYRFSEMLKFSLLSLALFSLVLSPWWIRNYHLFHEFIPATLSSGNPFLQGTYLNYDQRINYTPYETGKTVIETNENETAAGIYRLKTYAVQQPLTYLYWYTIGKSQHFWSTPFYWREILGIPAGWAVIVHRYMLLLPAAVGVYMLLKSRNTSHLPLFLLLVILYFNIIYLPFFTFSRYAYPLMPFVCLFAAYSFDQLIKSREKFYGQISDTHCR